MPTYRISAPDGKTYTVEGPAGATREQVISRVLSAYPEAAYPPAAPEQQEEPEGSFFDAPVQAAQGLTNVSKSFTDAAGANNAASRVLGDINEYLQGLLSAKARGKQEETARIFEAAEGKGIGAELRAAWKALKNDPAGNIAQAVGSVIPFLAASAVTGGAAVPAVLGAVSGAGSVKGSIYETVKAEALKAGKTAEEAEAEAQAAQAYGSKNTGSIALGAGLGAAASTTGAEQAVGRLAGQRIAQGATKRAIVGGVAKGAATEGVTEALQGGQEKLAGNLAAAGQGYDRAPMQGVYSQAALEGTLGALVGAPLGGVQGAVDKARPAARPSAAPSAPIGSPTVNEAKLRAFNEQRITEYRQQGKSEDEAIRLAGADIANADPTQFATDAPTPATKRSKRATKPPTEPPVASAPNPAVISNALDGNVAGPTESGVPSAAPVGPDGTGAAGTAGIEPAGRGKLASGSSDTDRTDAGAGSVLNPLAGLKGKAKNAAAAQLIQNELTTNPAFAGQTPDRKQFGSAKNRVRDRGITPAAALSEALGIAAPAAPVVAPSPVAAPATPPRTLATTAEAVEAGLEPPLAPGMVRMYHSGSLDKGGPRWFSSSRAYGGDYRSDSPMQFVDIPRDNPVFESDYADQTIDQGFTVNAELSEELANLRQPVERAPTVASEPVTPNTVTPEVAVAPEPTPQEVVPEETAVEEPTPTAQPVPSITPGVRNTLANFLYRQNIELTPEQTDAALNLIANSRMSAEEAVTRTAPEALGGEPEVIPTSDDDYLNLYDEIATATEDQDILPSERDGLNQLLAKREPVEKITKLLEGAKKRGETRRAKEYAALTGNRYRTGDSEPQGGVTSEEANSVIQDITSGWKAPVKTRVVQTVADLPSHVQKELEEDGVTDPRGFIDGDGTITVIAGNVESAAEVKAILFHEALGHLGLKKLFRDRLDRALVEIYQTNKSVREAANAWRKNTPGAYKNDNNPLARAVEEVLAEFSESGVIKANWKDKLRVIIKDFGRRMGIKSAVTDADIVAIMALAHQQAMGRGKTRLVGSDNRYIYVGKTALLVNEETYEEAVSRAEAGENAGPNSNIRVDTGWFLGPDNKWRFEINDQEAEFADGIYRSNGSLRITPGVELPLGLVFWHPALFKNYPSFAKINVKFNPNTDSRGSYNADTNTIELNAEDSEAEALDTIIHELQHSVQYREGFTFGASPKSFNNPSLSVLEKLVAFLEFDGSAPDYINEARAIRDAKKFILSPDHTPADKLRAKNVMRSLLDGPNGDSMKYMMYRLTYGEIEANDSAKRRTMSDIARKILAPNSGDRISRYVNQNPVENAILGAAGSVAQSQNRYAAKKTAAETLREKLLKSKNATELNTTTGRLLLETRSFADGKRLFAAIYDAGSAAVIRNALAFFTTEGVTRLAEGKINNIPEISKAVNNMAKMRLAMVAEFSKDIPIWEKFNRTSPEGGRKLADTMHAATLKQVDPTLHPDVQTAIINDPQLATLTVKSQISRRANEIREVYKLWDELGRYQNGKGQEIFKTAKKRYADNFDLHMQILQDTIENSALPGTGNQPTTPKGQLLAQITKSFQEAKKLGVYFPLMRYGSYWLRVGQGKNSEFYMFESATARNVAMRKIAEQNIAKTMEQQIADGELDIGDSMDALQNKMGQESKILKGIFELLDKGGVSDVQAVKDQVYQMYLMTLPEADIRKRFTKRQGRTGFSADALRNYITANNTTASQLSRLRYAPEIRLAVASAYGELLGNPDKDKLKLFVDEMAKRAASEITSSDPNSVIDRFIAGGNQMVFLWMLTSIKSALVQATQLPIVGFPVLAAKYGVTNATAISARYGYFLNKLSTVRVDDQGNVVTYFAAPSFKDSPYVRKQADPAYRAALKRAWEFAESNDLFMSTYAGDMSARSRTPSSEFQDPISRGGRAVMNMMTGAFHHMERMSRENMFMASFELEYAKAKKNGLSAPAAQARAENEALKTTNEALFNYTRYNKPRAFKTPLGRIAFQFLTYPMQMTSFLARNFYASLPYLNKQGKKEAAIKFYGTMGMTFMFAGVTGLPLYSIGMGFLEGLRELMRPDPDDPDADEYYDESDDGNPLGKRNLDLWFRETFLPEYFGDGLMKRAVEMGPISAATDLNIGASTSLDGLWFRDDAPAGTTKEAFQDFMFRNAFGPTGALGTQFASAYDDFNNGDWNKGVEKLLPAFLRGTATANRLSEEGVVVGKDRAPLKPPEFFTFGRLLAQAVGFGSTTIAEMQKAAILTNRVTKDIEAEKTKVLSKLFVAVEKFDKNPTDANNAAIDAAMDVIDEYNYKNGALVPITGDTIKTSLRGKFERRDSAVNGVYLSKRLSPFLQDTQSEE